MNLMQLHLIQLCNNEANSKAKLQIIKDWFGKQSFSWFASRYPVDAIAPATTLAFAGQIVGNKALDVSNIPVVWINNRVFPNEYNVADIRFLINDLNLLAQLTK